ncbi:uncharacterized protein LOC115214902 isoform X2 [Octopus sinensis]|uniref:Uncharacterized protein LOC115214902 isoform X2 n=1 Tax=Octopus sinensis TaxID=2607531 RepID=A0A6P7SNE5_9MOLL|nr:uncharacterized protein LOC115214902 isoform X2 [Octopus sinensis]
MDIVDLDKVLDDFEEDEEKASALVPSCENKLSGYDQYLPTQPDSHWELYSRGFGSISGSHQIVDQPASSGPTNIAYDMPYEAAHKFDIAEANFSVFQKECNLQTPTSVVSVHNEQKLNFQNGLNANITSSSIEINNEKFENGSEMKEKTSQDLQDKRPFQETQPPELTTPLDDIIIKTEAFIPRRVNLNLAKNSENDQSCMKSEIGKKTSASDLDAKNEMSVVEDSVECVAICDKQCLENASVTSNQTDTVAGVKDDGSVGSSVWTASDRNELSNSQEEPMYENNDIVIRKVEDMSAVCLNNLSDSMQNSQENLPDMDITEPNALPSQDLSYDIDDNPAEDSSRTLDTNDCDNLVPLTIGSNETNFQEVVGFDSIDNEDEDMEEYLEKCCSSEPIPLSVNPSGVLVEAECHVHSEMSGSPMELPEVLGNGVLPNESVMSENLDKPMDLSSDTAAHITNEEWNSIDISKSNSDFQSENFEHETLYVGDSDLPNNSAENGFPSPTYVSSGSCEPIENGFPSSPVENGLNSSFTECHQSSTLGARPKEPTLPKLARPNSLLGLSKVCLDTPFAAATVAHISSPVSDEDKCKDSASNGFPDATSDTPVTGNQKSITQQLLSPLQHKLNNMDIKQRLENDTEIENSPKSPQHNCDVVHLLPCDSLQKDGAEENISSVEENSEIREDQKELDFNNQPDTCVDSIQVSSTESHSSLSDTTLSPSATVSSGSGAVRPHSWSPSSGASVTASSLLKSKRPTSLNLPQRIREVNTPNDWSGGVTSQTFPNDSDNSSSGWWNQSGIQPISEENESGVENASQELTSSPTTSQSSLSGDGGVENSEEGEYDHSEQSQSQQSEPKPQQQQQQQLQQQQQQQQQQDQEVSEGDRTSHSQIGAVAPVWVPDADAPNCMQCEAKFRFTKRRHHCRACGKVFCSACCSMKTKLQYMENKEARVCLACHQLINIRELALDNLVITKSCCKEDVKAENRSGRSPNPNNPSEYCSTIPPLQQANAHVPLPTVMVPVGVLKREGSQRKGEPKQVIFSDGIRPGGDLTEEADHPQDSRLPPRRTGRVQKKVERITQGNDQSITPRTRCLRSANSPRNKCHIPENGLPPVLLSSSGKDYVFDENPDVEQILTKVKSDEHEPVIFSINNNLFVSVKIVQLDCCVNRTCWAFTTKGMCTVGQDEIVIVLECFQDEKMIPKDIFWHFHTVYEEAYKGNPVSDMGHTIFNQSFLGSRDHGGFLYIRPTFQCLQKITLPSPPYLFGILLQTWEAPWAKVFPIRLLLRLGAEYRYYPCPLISVRNRKPVFCEIGHTIMNLLADFRNYQYMLPQIKGVTIHMEDKRTVINFPRNRYDDLMKVVMNSNEHVMALAANFSAEADSHLVCIQNDDGNYQTQAINIQNKPRKGTYSVESDVKTGDFSAHAHLLVTGASFVVFNGALKTSSGLTAKSSIVEDGLMVQISPDSMAALKQSMKDMTAYTIGCGSLANSIPDEIVLVHWVEDDKNVNIGLCSVIDNMSLDGVESIHIHNSPDYIGECRAIRWTEVFLIQNEESTSSRLEPVDLSRLAETLAQACCIALTPHLDRLKESSISKLGLRVNIESERVGYEIGSNGTKLPDFYMNDLDSELIPVIHNATSHSQDGPISLELIFHILD